MHTRSLLLAAVLNLACFTQLRGDLITDEVFLNGSSAHSGASGDSAITFRTNTLTSSLGVTFRLQFVGTAAAGTIQFISTDLGIQQTVGQDQFDEAGDAITFNSLSVVDFDAGLTSLTVADVTAYGFTNVSLNAAGSPNDQGTVNGVAFAQEGNTPIVIAGAPAPTVTLVRTNGTFRLDSLGFTATVSAVPEPSCMMVMALALLGVSFRQRSIAYHKGN